MTMMVKPTTGRFQAGKGWLYFNEPFYVAVYDTDQTAKTIFVDVLVRGANSATGTLLKNYAVAEVSSTSKVVGFDLMEMAREIVQSNIKPIGDLRGLENFKLIRPSESLDFRFYSDKSTVKGFRINPIYGGRNLHQIQEYQKRFNPTDLPLNEFEFYKLQEPRWNGYPRIRINFDTIVPYGGAPANEIPRVDQYNDITGKRVEGAYLLWRSRFGGWMHYGFDIFSENESSKYTGDLGTTLFESNMDLQEFATSTEDGKYALKPNYVGKDISRDYSLTALQVPNDYAKCIQGINASTMIFLMRAGDTRTIELVKLKSVSAPISNITLGCDVKIKLQSISSEHLTVS